MSSTEKCVEMTQNTAHPSASRLRALTFSESGGGTVKVNENCQSN